MSTLAILMMVLLGASAAIAQGPVPYLDAPLSPGQKAPGSAQFTLTVYGTGFASDAVVYWNGNALTTTFVTSEKLTATVPAADVAKAGTAWVTVKNGTGVVSNTDFFEIIKNGFTVANSTQEFATANNPQDVTTADFNGDGILDLALPTGSNSVSVLLGAGGGSFDTAVPYAVPAYPVAIVHGDFTGTGIQDLATADQYGSEVSVLLGNGDGTFQSHVEYSTGTQTEPVALATADVNGDGYLDLIVANYKTNTVSVLLGNGNGTFQTHVDYPTGNGPEAVAVGDFNGDGYLDLAVVNNTDSTVSIFLNNGNGTFGTGVAYTTAVNPTSIAVGDFSNNGILDLAVATSNKTASVLLGNGNGTFQNPVNYTIGSGAVAIVVADVNSDGILDMITANYNDNTVSVLIGTSTGTFKSQSVFPTGAGPSGLAVGDFTDDGKLNIAAAAANGNEVSVLTDSLVTLSPSLLPFGTETSGDPSAAKTVTMKNTGTTPYTVGTISQVGAYYTDFTQTNTCTGGTLAAGASCTFSVTFDPTASEAANAQLLMTQANGSVNGFQMTGDGNVPITLAPRTITYKGYQLVGTTSAPKTSTFTNDSGVPITLTNIAIVGLNQNQFTMTTNCPGVDGNSGTTLAAGASCTSTLSFAPTVSGTASTAQIYYGNFTTAEAGLLASGEATAVQVTPTSITFPSTADGSTSTATVNFFNAGSVPLAISSLNFTNGTENYFSTTGNTCNYPGGSVPADTTCTITLQFAPLTTGTFSADLSIGDSDPTGPQIVALSGTGTAAAIVRKK